MCFTFYFFFKSSISPSFQVALVCAAEKDHSDCVRLLIDAGADKDAKDAVRHSRSSL